MEQRKEAEEVQRLRELYLWEQAMNEQKKREDKINIMKAHQVRFTQVPL